MKHVALFEHYQEPNDNFKQWFGASKAVGTDGNPLMMYHGSKVKELTSFDPESIKSGVGFWFTDNQASAQSHTFSVDRKGRTTRGHVVTAYLSIQNPATTIEDYQRGVDGNGDSYDRYMPLGTSIVVAFHPEQIKSVDNNGTWNPRESDIFN